MAAPDAARGATDLAGALAALSLRGTPSAAAAAAAAPSPPAAAARAGTSGGRAAAPGGSNAALVGPALLGLPAEAALQGMGPVLEALREAICWPLQHAQQGEALGVRWPRGLLLHGPPGCGKTAAVQAVAAECGAALHTITAASVFGAYTGESELRLREAFEAAAADASAGRAAVVFLDEMDALCPRRDGQRQHEARVVGQLLTLLDGAATGSLQAGSGSSSGGSATSGSGSRTGSKQGGGSSSSGGSRSGGGRSSSGGGQAGHIIVVGATSRPNALDAALRRPGRLDREVALGVPDAAAREAILRLLTGQLPLDPGLDLASLAARCHGYTGADLSALCREAAMRAIAAAAAAAAVGTAAADSAISSAAAGAVAAAAGAADSAPNPAAADTLAAAAARTAPAAQTPAAAAAAAGGVRPVGLADFEAAMRRVGPSVARGAALELPPVSWEAIGGLEDVKRRLRQAVEWPLRHSAAFDRLGLSPPRGVLLHGPPGCSKTTLARAAATASGATFIAMSGAQLYSMYVGEGEALLRDAFRRARLAAPAIVFLDELDSLVGRRVEGEQSDAVSARILSSLLTEMDGMELAAGVLVLAATNRPQAIDAALLRPGRFDLVLFVPPPDEQGRLQALQIHSKGIPLAADVDLPALAQLTHHYTGAELAAVCREAAMSALREAPAAATEVAQRHLKAAVHAVRPLLTQESVRQYAAWRQRAPA